MKRKHTWMLWGLALIMAMTSVMPAMAYKDTQGRWFTPYVDWATNKGYLEGYPDGSFKPNETLTKAEFYRMVNQLTGSERKVDKVQFADVNPGDWYYDEVAKGIAFGYLEDDPYIHKPMAKVTREEACRILAYVYGLEEDAHPATVFSDLKSMTRTGAIGALVKKGVVAGYPDGSFKPTNQLTRVQGAILIKNCVDEMGNPGTRYASRYVDEPVYRDRWWYDNAWGWACDYPEEELAKLRATLDLAEETPYYNRSAALNSAIDAGQKILDNVYRTGDYYPWYNNLTWSSNRDDFVYFNRNKGFSDRQLRDIWDRYDDYNGYWGWWGWSGLTWSNDWDAFVRANRNSPYTYDELWRIWSNEYGWSGYYGYYNYCANYSRAEINAAREAIIDAMR